MTMGEGKLIVGTALGISLLSAALVSGFLLFLVGGIAVLGFLYSWKHVFLKRSHLTAAFAITAVRGILINAGFYLHFSGQSELVAVPAEIWLLTVFITLFSLGIAWFKDIPDMRGDAEAQIGTLAVKTGARKAFAAGVVTVAVGYLAGVLVPLLAVFSVGNPLIIAIGHLIIGGVFIAFSAKTDPREHREIQRFYRLFWVLFFAEYIVFAAAFAAA
jgi:homogentisate phytyltransferase/homogentisate geranylgeranyltransferase